MPPHIPVIGNGDVCDAASYRDMIAKTGCDGVAIGRAALGNPWVFAEIRAALAGASFTPPTEEERRREALRLARDIVGEHGDSAAAREKVWLYAVTAYRLINPPMELPAMKVCSRSGRVGKCRSI